MKCVVRGQSEEKRLPEVGVAWKHEDREKVYLRIQDAEGRRARGHSKERAGDVFYSVDLGTGDIVWTPKSVGDTDILAPKNGELMFEVER